MRVRVFAGLTAVACVVGAWLTVPVLTQEPAQQEPPAGQALVQYVQQVISGTAAPPDASLTWQPYFVKSEGDQVYVPFTVAMEAGVLARDVDMYYTVVPKGPRMLSFAEADVDGEPGMVEITGELTNTASEAFENVAVTVTMLDATGLSVGTQRGVVESVPANGRATFSIPVKVPETTEQYSVMVDSTQPVFTDLSSRELPNTLDEPVRFSRAFVAPPGEYELYLVLREQNPSDGVPAKTALLNESFEVPDLSAELAVSSIFVASSIEARPTPLDPDLQMEEPFTLGNMAIQPATSTMIEQSGELSILFFVYNTGLDANRKPNVEVLYNFHRRTDQGEAFFNRTNPQAFNAQTLPEQFDLAAGHQIVGGQSVGMSPFEPGDYRLEIRVSDKLSGGSVTSNVLFTVTS